MSEPRKCPECGCRCANNKHPMKVVEIRVGGSRWWSEPMPDEEVDKYIDTQLSLYPEAMLSNIDCPVGCPDHDEE